MVLEYIILSSCCNGELNTQTWFFTILISASIFINSFFTSFFNNGGSYYQASRAAINMFYPCVVFNEHQEHQSLVVLACVSILQLSDLHYGLHWNHSIKY